LERSAGHRAAELTEKGKHTMRRLPLFSAVAALLLAVPLVTPASAGQVNSAPTRQTATSSAFARHGSASGLSLNHNAINQSNARSGGSPGFSQSNTAPTVSTALSTALSIGGDAGATGVNTNGIIQGNLSGRKGAAQLNSAPTVQAAVGAAVAIDGNASALATNSNGIAQGNAR
jgi:hypothetical protein